MDPLSITAAVVGISDMALKVTKSLNDMRSRYRNASLTVTAICSESAIINASLSQIQSLMFRDGDAIIVRFQERPDLCSTFDIALTCCQLLFSCLDDEVSELRAAARAPGGLHWQDKVKSAWKEDTMVGLLVQLQGQATALGLLLQALHMETSADIRQLLEAHGTALNNIKSTTQSLRKAYPTNRSPASIVQSSRASESIFAADTSGHDQTEFVFDDIVVNSKAYRRAMALAEAQISQRVDKALERTQSNPTRNTKDEKYITVVDALDKAASPVTDEEFPMDTISGSVANIQTRLRESRGDDWSLVFGLDRADLDSRPRREIEAQFNYWELTATGYKYTADIVFATKIYGNQIEYTWPVLVNNPEEFNQTIFEPLKQLGSRVETHLNQPLAEDWSANGAWCHFNAQIFTKFLSVASRFYVAYCSAYPRNVKRFRKAIDGDVRFRDLVDHAQLHPSSRRLRWDSFLKIPITHLQRLALMMETLRERYTQCGKTELAAEIKEVIEQYKELVRRCDVELADAQCVIEEGEELSDTHVVLAPPRPSSRRSYGWRLLGIKEEAT